ncbi:antibiotic biosynthesis monooxygenase [Vibrio sp. SCSIO 43132]|uniref:putative quinol monooxygenase n=1 Tax=Vibrio sp. SCSIO 43132 TaxID=2779363 RepID=UPI001CA9B4DC|nr:putative quinol monooxygenase [Vibrio sp. SCSIO 43132]UAB73935.1 antibiotic biosynthesis monooxygenase [Vibrio sp. SCSIO 43132]
MIHLLACFTAKSGQEEQLKSMLREMIEPTRAELGCVRYELFEDNGQEGHFIFNESFIDQKAFEEHQATPHFLNLIENVGDLLAEEIKIITLSPVE